MPGKKGNTNNARSRRRRPRRRRVPARNLTGINIRAPVTGHTTLHTVLRDNISGSGSISTPASLQLMFSGSRLAIPFVQARILRVGITILPLSYSEFIVSGINDTRINTRTELLNQPDCIRAYANARPVTYWFKPNQTLYMGWFDYDSTSTVQYSSGLWLTWAGQNQLNPTGSDVVLQISFDLLIKTRPLAIS